VLTPVVPSGDGFMSAIAGGVLRLSLKKQIASALPGAVSSG